MIKSIFYFLLFSNIITCSQEKSIDLDEVVLSGNLKIRPLLKKIKNELIKHADTINDSFSLNQLTSMNEDTLLFIDEDILMKVKSFDGSFKMKHSNHLTKHIQDIDFKYFSKYPKQASPLGWISSYPKRNNLNIVNLDFIRNYKDYYFTLEQLDEYESVLHFYSDSLFTGEIGFNSKTKQPTFIKFYNSVPYLFTHTSFQNLRATSNFESSWNYINQKVQINFQTKNGKISITKLIIEEDIVDFEHKNFDKKGQLIFSDKNRFSTKIFLVRNE